ncbi:hypothetical protein QEH59_17390 [Coraliomargarita sp. SDUM461004]|uniref:RHS repeat protein n=1 Tax=Thalassobacterium sedimentorum TaxID=3041258 RepID=A0ABU1AN37_9BACT|nr:hypothetical protein [Coraliomargarita sp. SDUM461004]MDQ8196212.1 hypothetical protein [Coraliomargarita sp. SDUM461004]
MSRLSSLLKSALLALLAATSGAVIVGAQGLLLGSRPNVLGNANQFGYARIVKELGSFPLGESRSLPVSLVFSSDPSIEPGLLGPGWSLPLFDSTAYRSRRGVLVWESPDEYRRFFVADSQAEVRRDENGYVSQKTDWVAVEHERRGSIRIMSVKDPEQMFEYRDGQLFEFCYGKGTPTYAVVYGGRGNLRRVFDRDTQRTVMEVRYSGSDVQELVVGEQSTEVQMGEGDWTVPDGKVNYRNYRVSFLLRLGSEADGERYSYTKDDTVTRAVAKGQRLAVNRLTLEDSGRESWLSYEAQSGLIVADSGGVYTVQNDAYNPFVEAEKGQPRVSPRLVKIERQPNSGGKPEMWSRDWPKGLETFTEPDGKLTRRTWIMANGAAYGKLRRIEEQVDGKWEMVKMMTYRPDGKLLREIDKTGKMIVHEYAKDGALNRTKINGVVSYLQSENLGSSLIIEKLSATKTLTTRITNNVSIQIIEDSASNQKVYLINNHENQISFND